MTQTEATKYAQALLRQNPYHSAQQVVEQRARFLGVESQASLTPGAGRELPQRRQKAEAALAGIRAELWVSPLSQIQSRLAALKLECMPDLAASAARLARAAEVRPEFERLYSERKINKPFVGALQQILVLPPAAAGQRKNQEERELCHWRGRRAAKNTVRFIKRNYPRIYQLEREWFYHIDSTSRFARPVKRAKPAQDPSARNQLWLWLVLVVISSVIRIILPLFK